MKITMKHNGILFALLAGGIFATDQYCKNRVEQMPGEELPRSLEPLPVILRRSHNKGMFMNLLDKWPKASAAISCAALAAAAVLYLPAAWKNSGRFLEKTGAALILGGALSNVWDRLKRGYVVDYISFPLKPIRHIVFNIGDFAIFSGLSAFIGDHFHLG